MAAVPAGLSKPQTICQKQRRSRKTYRKPGNLRNEPLRGPPFSRKIVRRDARLLGCCAMPLDDQRPVQTDFCTTYNEEDKNVRTRSERLTA
jgi:hypothetical protein